MNLLRQIKFPQVFTKWIRQMASAADVEGSVRPDVGCLILEELPRRDIVRVKGDDATEFLQGLITNDMKHLQHTDLASMYTMFLNTSGRILYDAIVYRTKEVNSYLIECDQDISLDLRRHMRTHLVRRKLQIEAVNNEYKMWIVFDPKSLLEKPTYKAPDTRSDVYVYHDPRIRDFGIRLLSKANTSWMDLSQMFKVYNSYVVTNPNSENNYKLHRYRYGLAEGAFEIPPGKLFPLEANVDFLNGVSFHKGCYIGQELTARVHHTGAVRKRHMPLKLTEPITKTEEIVQTQAGSNLGIVLGAEADRAVALLRVESALSANSLMIDGYQCFVEKPKWWPKELPKRVSIRE